jgi:hypothetical protein
LPLPAGGSHPAHPRASLYRPNFQSAHFARPRRKKHPEHHLYVFMSKYPQQLSTQHIPEHRRPVPTSGQHKMSVWGKFNAVNTSLRQKSSQKLHTLSIPELRCLICTSGQHSARPEPQCSRQLPLCKRYARYPSLTWAVWRRSAAL